ncbi:hypothetical protein [Allomuricauda sp. SCSIO 65647]|uniref:hypothetical protein n=1 Tax=Allomuricauda sp. SCSIO 65647 TaxID=2908843 RepID=UPI001F47C647|nr:hypothetical protein [Muricauda sp. SCSIO 65647]UJH66547.1 hypothetical protein L0P89_11305 [Muricauda sp. SCSIO 65647]
MKNIIVVLMVFLGANLIGNAQFSDYKYVVVPKRFEGFKKENQYSTSTLIKHLLTQQGFNAVYDDFIALKTNPCLGAWVRLQDDSSLFLTKTSLIFEDCEGNSVFETAQGRSKVKQYKASYEQAIREAFFSMAGVTHNYVPKEETEKKEETVTLNFKNDVKSLKNEGQAVEKTATVNEQKTVSEKQPYKTSEPKESDMAKATSPEKNTIIGEASKIEVLYAQPIERGYQLVDTTPSVRYKLQETSVPNVYLVVGDNKNGIVFQKEGKWFLQYEDDKKDVMKELNIKF